jgi:hypothetical protein
VSSVHGDLGGLFDGSMKAIEAEYRWLRHTRCWRFLMGPSATLSTTIEIALLTLNPGGHGVPKGHPCASRESGSAYFDEQWSARAAGSEVLQIQIQRLCVLIQQELGDRTPLDAFMAEKILCACFVPFRSSQEGVRSCERYRTRGTAPPSSRLRATGPRTSVVRPLWNTPATAFASPRKCRKVLPMCSE